MTQKQRGDLAKRQAPNSQRTAAAARERKKIMTFAEQDKDLKERSMILKDALEDVKAHRANPSDIQPMLDSVVKDLRDRSRGKQASKRLEQLARQLQAIPWMQEQNWVPGLHDNQAQGIADQINDILRSMNKTQAQAAIRHQIAAGNLWPDDGGYRASERNYPIRNPGLRFKPIEKSSRDALVQHLGESIENPLMRRGVFLEHLREIRDALHARGIRR